MSVSDKIGWNDTRAVPGVDTGLLNVLHHTANDHGTCGVGHGIDIEFEGIGGKTLLTRGVGVTRGEVVDAAFMSKKALCSFLEEQIDTTESGVLFSLHLKATMMKISDPIMFGHCVRAYYKDAFDKHITVFEELGVDANNGVADAYEKIESLPMEQAHAIKVDLDACLETGPDLAMVNSGK